MTDETLSTGGQNNQTANQQPADTGADNSQQAAAPETNAESKQNHEARTSDNQQPDDKSTATDAGDKPEGAPETYEFKAPEGQEFDQNVIDAFSDVAKDLNLSQENAQKVLDKMAPVIQARQSEQIAAAQEQWASDTKADKEIGGDKLNDNLAVAKKALDTFGTPALKDLLNASGLGNHPEVIRAFYRAGKQISEDAFVGGKPQPASGESVAQRMYPNMNP